MTDTANTPPNPLLKRSGLPLDYPRFNEVRFEHFEPALRAMMANEVAMQAEVLARPASFENTILGLEANADLADSGGVYSYFVSNCATTELLALRKKMSPVFAAHGVSLAQDPAYYQRISEVQAQAATLDPVQQRLVKIYHTSLVDSGAALSDDKKAEFKALQERLSTLTSQFSTNMINDAKAKAVHITDEAELAGVPDSLKKSLASNAKESGKNGYLLPINGEIILEFLRYAENRPLRQQVWEVQQSIGNSGGETDNNVNVRGIVETRQAIAAMLGYPDYATFAVKDRMAKTPSAALSLLTSIVPAARNAYDEEKAANTALAHAEGFTGELQPWDWHYYSRKREEQTLNFREEDLKPYLELNSVRSAFFAVCRDVFGVHFSQRDDLPLPHPDAQVWEAKNAGGQHVGLFITDDFARMGQKQDGAWASRVHIQDAVNGRRSIITNTMNYPKPPEGEACLLTLMRAVTLFHEGGHGLHGLRSSSPYPSLAGTSVPRDIVELPSQFMESMLTHPVLMKRHLRHYKTGEVIPDELIEKVQAKLKFGQGYRNLRQLSFGICDLELYGSNSKGFDPQTFEQQTLDAHGFPAGFRAKPGLTSFAHIMSGGYAAGYYGYMWADAVVADAVEAFKPDPLDPVLGASMATNIYASGNTRDPAESYRAFRGRDPDPKALMRHFGWS